MQINIIRLSRNKKFTRLGWKPAKANKDVFQNTSNRDYANEIIWNHYLTQEHFLSSRNPFRRQLHRFDFQLTLHIVLFGSFVWTKLVEQIIYVLKKQVGLEKNNYLPFISPDNSRIWRCLARGFTNRLRIVKTSKLRIIIPVINVVKFQFVSAQTVNNGPLILDSETLMK